MNTDVFSRPPNNTFMLGTKFSVIQDGKSIPAIAVSTSALPKLLALYTIIIQLLFMALWQLLAAILLLILRVNDRVEIVGVIAFWNSADPITATFRGFHYIKMLLGRPGSFKHLLQGFLMAMIALLTAGGGIGIGIKYADWLQLNTVAPAHPSAIFWPQFGEVTNEETVKIYSQSRPGILRALGSAEAVQENSQLFRVDVQDVTRPDSTVDEPQQQFDYNYALTAEDFSLQNLPDLVLNVRGSCRTDYTWMRQQKSSSGYTYDYYFPWRNETSNQRYRVANEVSPVYKLDFVVWLHPDIDTPAQARNRSFAFLATTAIVPSTTPSSDPWYKTGHSNTSTSLGLPYIVQSNRPVLDCWETTEICTGGTCYSTFLDGSPVSKGIAKIFKTRFAHPMITHVAMSAGVGAIKTYVGSSSGAFIDAASSTLHSDMTRLVLAGFLSSAQVFQELVLTTRPQPDSKSILEYSPGQLLSGASSFAVRTDVAKALRFDLLVLAPALFAFFWTAVGIVKIISITRGKSILKVRAAALSATQLYRQLDEASSKQSWPSKHLGSTIPHPPDPLNECTIKVVYDNGPQIHFQEFLDQKQQSIDSNDEPANAVQAEELTGRRSASISCNSQEESEPNVPETGLAVHQVP